MLSLPEVFIYSSNIGSAEEADMVGIEGHREFLKRMGLLDPHEDRAAGGGDADRAEGVEEGATPSPSPSATACRRRRCRRRSALRR